MHMLSQWKLQNQMKNQKPISHTCEIATLSWGWSRKNILLYKVKEYPERGMDIFKAEEMWGKGAKSVFTLINSGDTI